MCDPVPIDIVHKYACNNRKRPTKETSYLAQQGWSYVSGTRFPLLVEVKHNMSTPCKYDKSHKDISCAGCAHKTKEDHVS